MDFAASIDEQIPALYRFALLLTGNPATAQQALMDVCTQSSSQAEAFRSASNRLGFLVQKLREQCQKIPAASPGASGERRGIAEDFSRLPEPGRSALALFYLDLFSADESAMVLDVSLEEFAELLNGARANLQALPTR